MSVIKIVGLHVGGRGQNYTNHAIRGQIVKLGMVLKLQLIQIVNKKLGKTIEVFCIDRETYNNRLVCIVAMLAKLSSKKKRAYSFCMKGS